MSELPAPVQARLQGLPKGLREHIERSRQVASELASRHGVDARKADVAVAAHDLARAVKGDALLKEALRFGLEIHPVEQRKPLLLHGAIAAMWLEQDDGITDRDVLEAVRWHTTGRRGMGAVAKVVFLADKLDPMKVGRYPYLEKVRSIAQDSLDRAILELLGMELAYFLREGYLIHPETVELRNELMMTQEERPPRGRQSDSSPALQPS